MKLFWILAVSLLLAGWALIGEGSNLPLYSDEEEFQRRTMQINPEWSNARRLYRELRQEFLTDRIAYHDYGATLVIVGLLLPALPVVIRQLRRSAGKLLVAFGWGAAAASATVGAELVSLFLDAARGEFPWFADAIALPVVGLPVVWLLLLSWVGVHVGWWRWALRSPGGTVHWHLQAWLGILAILAGILALVTLTKGDFLFVVPSLLWLGFFSLLRRGLPATIWPPYYWRQDGPWWGALIGGVLLPLGLFLLCALCGDTGGRLIWPLASLFLSLLGVIVGTVERDKWKASLASSEQGGPQRRD